MEKLQVLPSHYVGVGASAGGLEAIEKFITNMPAVNNLAFIIIQHLSPDYKSLMVELLEKKTKMAVHRAEEGMEVLADNIYLIPPKKSLIIFHGKLLLQDKNPLNGVHLPIDIFLQSLAEDQGEKAVAIILSGTGSDGARGVRAVKENNGMVMVQQEISAKFDGMPKAAISTGTADYILPPEKMPAQLLSYVAHPHISGDKLSESLLEDADSLTRLFAEIRAKTKVDFTHYKPSTISRRIERRMTINQIADFDDYVRYLTNFPGEVMALYREMLIGVTSFFRDEDAMEEMRQKIIPQLFKDAKNREIRCWVAGCSTGEEAYSLAIMFKEIMLECNINKDVKIFATDIDREAIVKASNGVFPESIAADLPPHLLSKYFYHKEDAFQTTRLIREMVVFAQHNLINDPPFTNIDLVSCRNLLIYLQPVLQTKALAMFNFSLTPGGILFLGSSETIGEMTDYFKPLHQRFRIYQSRGRSNPTPDAIQISTKYNKLESGKSNQEFAVRRANRRADDRESSIIKAFLDLAAGRYFPLTIIVDEHLDIQRIIGDTTGYLIVPSGPIEYNISKLVAKELAIPLSTGIQKVFRSGKEVTYNNIYMNRKSQKKSIRITIHPLADKMRRETLVAAFLEERESSSSANNQKITEFSITDEAQQRIDDLEQELQFARENLQATIEELETSNEELQATNEELLASNEELQSTNEELQSTNEELYTVNAEHQNKIIELTELTNDVDNLLSSSGIGTLIIDENLEIRKFSPEITNIFNILKKDIGRPFSHLSHLLKDFDPVETAVKVQRDTKLVEQEVETKDGKKYIARILPYHIGPKIYSGVVLTFVDITEFILVRHDLEKSRKTVQRISENIPAGLLVFNLDNDNKLLLTGCNPEAEKITGISMNKWGGKPLQEFWPQMSENNRLQELIRVAETDQTCILEDIEFSDSDQSITVHIHAFRQPDNSLAISFEKRSQNFNYEKQAERNFKIIEMMLKSPQLPWWEWQVPQGTVVLGEALAHMIGKTEMEFPVDDTIWEQIIHPDDYNRVINARKTSIDSQSESYHTSYRLRVKNGTFCNVSERGEISAWNEHSQVARILGVLIPVAEQDNDQREAHHKYA